MTVDTVPVDAVHDFGQSEGLSPITGRAAMAVMAVLKIASCELQRFMHAAWDHRWKSDRIR